MFQPMRVYGDRERQAIQAHTQRMDYLREQATKNPNHNPNWEEVLNHHQMGGCASS